MRIKVFIYLAITFSIPVSGYAQEINGLQKEKDTSFNTSKEFKKILKNYPEAKQVELSGLKNVKQENDLVYCRTGEHELKLDVFKPASNSNKVAIIIIHGGGWRSGHKEQHHPMAERLASLGYTCFTPGYRLSTEALYPAAMEDISSVINWVKLRSGNYMIDTNMIVLAGFSAGGQMAALAANKDFSGSSVCNPAKYRVRALINIDGTLSFTHAESGEGDDSKKISAATYWFGYPKKSRPDLWEEASPLNYVSNSSPETLFINSAVPRMHAGRDDFRKRLSEFSIYSEVQELNAPHSFCLFEPWFSKTVDIINSFLKARLHLK